MAEPVITQTRIPVYVTGAPGPKGNTGDTGAGTNDPTKVLKAGDAMTGDLTNTGKFISSSPSAAQPWGFSSEHLGRVGYHMYNNGTVCEWLLYQPDHATGSDTFRIAFRVAGVDTDILTVSNAGGIAVLGDITANHNNDGTGYVFLGNSGRYIAWDGSHFVVNGSYSGLTAVDLVTCAADNLSGTLYFGAPANATYLHYSATGFAFNGNDLAVGSVKPVTDAIFQIGASSLRFTTVYAVTGAINTSDEREKEQIAAPTDAILDAWAEVQWVSYKWKDAVAEKGEAARLHIGLIAQRVAAVFEAHGLDGFALGLLCYDQWQETSRSVPQWVEGEVDEETGLQAAGQSIEGEPIIIPAGDRFGVRYEEALALEAALARRERGRLEARLAALEAV